MEESVTDRIDGARRLPRTRRVQITDRDRLLLAFAAEHRLVLPAHVQVLLGTSADAARARLRALDHAGFLAEERIFHRQPPCYQVTRRGLEVIGSTLPRPRLDFRSYAHDVGVAWLWLAARGGTWGTMREVVSERQMRSADGSSSAAERPRFGVRLGGIGPGGRERLHYPDLLMTDERGSRIAVELELTSKGRTRREKILAGYGGDSRFDIVLYLVEEPAVYRAVRDSARRLGISDRVHVQWVRTGGARTTTGRGRQAERTRGRSPDSQVAEAAR